MMNISTWKDLGIAIRDKWQFKIVIIVSAIIFFELMSLLSYKFLLIGGIPLPGAFYSILSSGVFPPVILSLVIIGLFYFAFCMWYLGADKRIIAQNLLLILIGFIFFTWLGLYGYCYWDSINVVPYPWLLYSLVVTAKQSYINQAHLSISLVVSYGVLVVLIVAKLLTFQTKAEKIFGKAHFANAFEIKRAGLFHKKGIVLGKAYGNLMKLSGFESALIVAPTGSGKTTAVAIPNLIEWDGSAIVNDLKGELFKLTASYRKEKLQNNCYWWSPADVSMKTEKYNPFYYVSTNSDLMIRDLQLIAETLIPEDKHTDAFWHKSAREIFIAIALYLFEKEGMPTLPKINDLSRQRDFFTWLDYAVQAEEINNPFFYQFANSLLEADKERSRPNLLKDFHSRMNLFIDPIIRNAVNGNDFDFRELRKKRMTIYVCIPDADKERLKPILTLFWAQVINSLSQHEPDLSKEPYPLLALMDEFGNLSKIEKLQQGMTFLRAYRTRCIIIVQYLAQIVSAYGKEDAKAFLNGKVKIAYALNDPDDAEFFSKAMGYKTVKVTSNSINTGQGDQGGSRSDNVNYQSRLLITPDEIMQLPQKYELILLEGRSPIKAQKTYWFKEAIYKNLFQ